MRKVTAFLIALLALTIGAQAKELLFRQGSLVLHFAQADKSFDLYGDKGDKLWICNFSPKVVCYHKNGQIDTLISQSFLKVETQKKRVNDAFGKGICLSFLFSQPRNESGVQLCQRFFFYEGCDYLLTDVTLSGGEELSTNFLAPVWSHSPYSLFKASPGNRMLKVPFDNDSFVRYHTYKMDTSMTSYEVAALYQGERGGGLVAGAVEHAQWKNAVKVTTSANGKVDSFLLFSGAADSETRDVLPHGRVKGLSVKSSLMFLGYFDDWRRGMESFAQANTKVQPRRENWKKGTPFGWQSWGVMSDKNSFSTDADVSAYFYETLKKGGFVNDKGVNVISIDAWDNLSHKQKVDLCALCASRGQVAGTYCTPFALWWNEEALKTKKLEGQDTYTGWDCVIKVNGRPYMLDGAYCLDPTHPGTKAYISLQLKRMRDEGFDYIKVDFTSNGMVQADSYYNPRVTTAVEAYNEGFSHFIKEAGDMFIALSIAPLFPYQYGNSRRIACDTWGKINHTEYSLNAISGGWWSDRLYQYNDPDHVVLVGNDAVKETLGENRARLTNAAISGMVLVADNYSLGDTTGRGDARLSRERAGLVLMNKDVNEMANLGCSFYPVYGCKEYNGRDDGAENFFMYHTRNYLYVAVVNYKDELLRGGIPLDALSIAPYEYEGVKELWSGREAVVSGDSLRYEVQGRDACIYRFHKIEKKRLPLP